ncbi:hypothetical protein HNR19_000280 [Nocardioides thalensis]|uniref:Uncharacterized protein n=1 Tax=Nocardioides thalensis TaxID=1914755 RepID=A0A853BYL7_9ACTN|nr:hypothetical protein [Nocardioides thalensis]NYI99581.1 hypothetical protein [Nocardioides thalensis]
MSNVLDSLSEATGALKDATDRAEVAYRSLEYVAPKLAEEARRLALQAEDVLVRVAHAQEALSGVSL